MPFLVNGSKLAAVKSINIVTGYGKTRMRGARHGDDGMRKRVRGMLRYMNVKEKEQPNKGRVQIDKEAFTREVSRQNGKIVFDAEGYRKFRELETTANAMPDVVQIRRPRMGAPRKEDRQEGGCGRDEHGDRNGRRRDDDQRDKSGGRDQRYRRDDNRDRYEDDMQRSDRRGPNNRRHDDYYRRGGGNRSEERHQREPPRTRPHDEDYRRRSNDGGYQMRRVGVNARNSRSRSRSRSQERRRGGGARAVSRDRYRESHRDRFSPGRYREQERRRGDPRSTGGKSPDAYRRRDDDHLNRRRSRSRSRDRHQEYRGARDLERNQRFTPPQTLPSDRFISPSSTKDSAKDRQKRASSKYEDDRINSRTSDSRDKSGLADDNPVSSGEIGIKFEPKKPARGYDIGDAPLCSKRGYDV